MANMLLEGIGKLMETYQIIDDEELQRRADEVDEFGEGVERFTIYREYADTAIGEDSEREYLGQSFDSLKEAKAYARLVLEDLADEVLDSIDDRDEDDEPMGNYRARVRATGNVVRLTVVDEDGYIIEDATINFFIEKYITGETLITEE